MQQFFDGTLASLYGEEWYLFLISGYPARSIVCWYALCYIVFSGSMNLLMKRKKVKTGTKEE
jgi:hypothetical protein